MIKILALEALFKRRKNPLTGEEIILHSGVDFARIVQPIKALGEVDGFKVDIVWDYPLELDKIDWWEKTLPKYDIVYMTYLDNSLLYAAIQLICNKAGVKVVIDLDDHIWAVSRNHHLYEAYRVEYDPTGHPRFSDPLYKRTVILGNCNYVTTTCQYLKYRIVEFAKRDINTIGVIPNYIDLSLYDYKNIGPKESKEFVIGYHGGASHFDDLNKRIFIEAINTIFRKYPNTIFRTTGFFFPQLKAIWGRRYQFKLARGDVYRWATELWPEHMGDSDIVVAPLEQCAYSRGKSYIKYLEYSAGKKAGIYENIDPYQGVVKDGENGFLAGTYEDWVKKLSLLIENEELRKRLGENAFETVQKHQIQKNVGKYADFFTGLLKKT